MTIGIALKYKGGKDSKGGVVLACDSQATAGGGEPYQQSISKLEQLDRSHGVVMAGATPISKLVAYKVREQLQREQNPDTAKIAEITYATLTSLYREQSKDFGGVDVLSLANRLPAQLLIGGYDENSGPQIWAVNSPGLYNPVDEWDTIGSGKFYAGEILEAEYFPDMELDWAQFLATRAVIQASKTDPYVGKKIRMATLDPRFPGGYLDDKDIGFAEQKYRPLVEQIFRLRRDLDRVLMGDRDEESIARLLGTLNISEFDVRRYLELARELQQ